MSCPGSHVHAAPHGVRSRRLKAELPTGRGPDAPVAAARFGLLPMPPTRGEATDGRQPVPTLVGRVRAAALPHRSCGSRSGDFHESEASADLRDHGLSWEEPGPDAEALLGLRVARAKLLGHAHWDLPSHHLDGPPLPIAPGRPETSGSATAEARALLRSLRAA